MLHMAHMPYIYWPDALLTTVFLINRLPSPNTNKRSPFELFYNTKPDYNAIRTFGWACFPLLPSHARHKLQPKSMQCVFMGYSDMFKGYKCLDISTNKIIISRHLRFNEQFFSFHEQKAVSTPSSTNLSPFMLTPYSSSSIQQFTVPSNLKQNSVNTRQTDEPAIHQQTAVSPILPEPQISQNAAPVPQRHHMITRNHTGSLKPVNRLNLLHNHVTEHGISVPTTYTEAVKSPEWRKAMSDEFIALQQ
ncbi:hypothetical protein KFK09_013335 [Dendrobium nobile]|uniref:Retroviral polymerase SH3-like domain-containing protein n=1 Tax=Dendrobium nobile TaxID=94219 RepID=A0A8T3B719_DENNO|nr:hypothetical protein KFK09_013335 [Dendrobium nobile]